MTTEAKKTAYQRLNDDVFTKLNINAVKELGIYSALFLCTLLRIQDLVARSGKLQPDGSFYVTVEKMYQESGLKSDAQTTAVKRLQKAGYLKMELHGAPPVRHFKLNDDLIYSLTHSSSANSESESLQDSDTLTLPDSNPAPSNFLSKNSGEITKENENRPNPRPTGYSTPLATGDNNNNNKNKYSTSYISSKDDIHSVLPHPVGCSEELFVEGSPQRGTPPVPPVVENPFSHPCRTSYGASSRTLGDDEEGCGGVTICNTPPGVRSNVSSAPKTKKSAQQKTNAFITRCEKQAAGFKFDKQVLSSLSNYFRMLASSGALLPEQTIQQQLQELSEVRSADRVKVVKDTISSGWKSLRYAIEHLAQQRNGNKGGGKPSTFVDTFNYEALAQMREERKHRKPNPNYNPKEVF